VFSHLSTKPITATGRILYKGTILICVTLFASEINVIAKNPSPVTQERDSTIRIEPAEQAAQLLESGKPIEREMAGDLSHSYRFTLIDGQLLHAVVDQRGIDVVVTLFGPEGIKIVEVDSPNGTQGPEPVWAIAEFSGDYRLEVRSLEANAKPGRYEVRIEEIRIASQQDRNRIGRERALLEARLLHGKGDEKSLRGAIAKYEEASNFSLKLRDSSNEAAALYGMGLVHYSLGEVPKALEVFERVLPIYRDLQDRHGEASTLNNIGQNYYSIGKYEKALRFLHQALEILQPLRTDQSRPVLGTVLVNIGAIYARLGYLDRALDKYNLALPILQKLPDRSFEAVALNNIGEIYNSKEPPQPGEAMKYFERALPINQARQDASHQATLMNNTGYAHFLTGNLQQAIEDYKKALLIFQELHYQSQEAGTRSNIGQAMAAKGSQREALEYYEQARDIFRSLGDHWSEVAILGNIGTHYESMGQEQSALNTYRKGIDILEDIRRSAAIEQIKARLSDSLAPFVQQASPLLIRSGQPIQAFDLTEVGRARALLDQLRRSRLNFETRNDQLTKDSQELESRITFLQKSLEKEVGEGRSSLEIEYVAAQRQYEDFLIRRGLAPQNRDLSPTVKTLRLSEVQSRLREDTTLLAYFVLPEKTLAFVIRRDFFRAVEIPVSKTELRNEINWLRRFSTLRNPPTRTLKQLYTWLIDPVRQYITTSTLGIIPHKELHYLPFAALNNGQVYFGDEHTLFYLPSASALAFMGQSKPIGNRMLALAQSQTAGLPSLQFADNEAETVARTYKTHALMTNKAAKSGFVKRAGKYNIIHIVAHAEVNTASPLFYRLRLGASKGDTGALEVREIYKLNLTKVSLVVLAACQTELGEHSEGDDIVALSRAFMSAGASTVIASLWNVDDEASGMLMKLFYIHLKQGISKAEALRVAQRETRKKYPHPYYWAGFVLTGDPGAPATRNAICNQKKGHHRCFLP
jgi:CHAT domain-containing protein/Tfp pilus assembly protein PilF